MSPLGAIPPKGAAPGPSAPIAQGAPVVRSPAAMAWRRLRRNRVALGAATTLLLVVLACLVGPPLLGLTGINPTAQNLALGASPPSSAHWMGTDPLGRDLLVRTLIGGRIAIGVGVVSAAVSLLIGVLWGAIAGFRGGRTDEVMMRFVDVLYALPSTLFVLVVMAILDTKSLFWLFALLGAVSWLTMSRIVRGQIMSLRHREFVVAARGLGATSGRILIRHLLPNVFGTVIVYTTLTIPSVMLQEAFLSFLGLGVQAPLASWGTLVYEGSQQMVVYPWLLIGPAIWMSVTIFAFNFIGDGIRDALDPKD